MKSSEAHVGLKPVGVKEKGGLLFLFLHYVHSYFSMLPAAPSQDGKERREEAKQGLT